MGVSGRLHIPSTATPQARAALQDAQRALHLALLTPGLAAVDPSDPPWDLIQHLDDFWAAYDRFLDCVLQAMPVTCGRGCSACCFDNPHGVTGVELLWLYRSLPADADLGPAAEHFQDLSYLHGVHAQAALIQLKQPCPVLRDGVCGAYGARPVACRMHFALSPPEVCDPHHELHALAINPQVEPGPAIRDQLLSLSRSLGLGDLPTDLRRGLAAVHRRLHGAGLG